MRKKIILSIILLTLIISSIVVYHILTRDFIYTRLEDGTWELSEYRGDGGVVHIPDKVWGKPVTRIGRSAFLGVYADEYELEQVDIPKTVVEIGSSAFRGCEELSITGGENVEVIEHSAFAACAFTTEFPFSDKLRYIGDFAFGNTNIKKVVLGDSVEVIEFAAFADSDLEKLAISDSIVSIGQEAFDHTPWAEAQTECVIIGDILVHIPKKEQVVVPTGVKTISTSGTINEVVEEIYIADTVEKMEGLLVFEATHPVTIYIPASVESIQYCDEVTNLVYRGDSYVTYVVEAGSYAEEYANQMAEQSEAKVEVVDKIVYPE